MGPLLLCRGQQKTLKGQLKVQLVPFGDEERSNHPFFPSFGILFFPIWGPPQPVRLLRHFQLLPGTFLAFVFLSVF